MGKKGKRLGAGTGDGERSEGDRGGMGKGAKRAGKGTAEVKRVAG